MYDMVHFEAWHVKIFHSFLVLDLYSWFTNGWRPNLNSKQFSDVAGKLNYAQQDAIFTATNLRNNWSEIRKPPNHSCNGYLYRWHVVCRVTNRECESVTCGMVVSILHSLLLYVTLINSYVHTVNTYVVSCSSPARDLCHFSHTTTSQILAVKNQEPQSESKSGQVHEALGLPWLVRLKGSHPTSPALWWRHSSGPSAALISHLCSCSHLLFPCLSALELRPE